MECREPKVAIIILNWNGLEDAIECLESLKRITYPHYKVVLVDNGSVGNDAEVLRERFGDYVHLIENDKNYGFAEGCNIGMRYALRSTNPDYVLLLNNDIVADPGFLSGLVEAAEGDASIGIVGPKIYYHSEPNRVQSAGGTVRWSTGETFMFGAGEIDSGQFDEMKEVDWVIGCALLIKRNVIESVGLIHPEYFSILEETDWCVRCKKAGYKVVYVPDARLWHKAGRDIGRVFGFRIYYRTRNRFLFMKRNATKRQFISFLAYFFFGFFPFTAGGLLFKHRDVRSLAMYCAGIRDGILLTLKGDRGGG